MQEVHPHLGFLFWVQGSSYIFKVQEKFSAAIMISCISCMEITCSSLHSYMYMFHLFILSSITDLKVKKWKEDWLLDLALSGL